jgi:hypothetical protein
VEEILETIHQELPSELFHSRMDLHKAIWALRDCKRQLKNVMRSGRESLQHPKDMLKRPMFASEFECSEAVKEIFQSKIESHE